jgi:predicted flap endonuclease-1-like 5' DNA nuclease
MEEPTPSRHRRRERRRDRTARAPAEPAAETPADSTADTAAEATTETAAESEAETAAESEAETAAAGDAPEPAPRRKSRSRRTDAERSLRGIVGAGSSQVGVVGAMRARDAARPTAEDLAAAERDLVIVRRHYVPPGTLPGAR